MDGNIFAYISDAWRTRPVKAQHQRVAGLCLGAGENVPELKSADRGVESCRTATISIPAGAGLSRLLPSAADHVRHPRPRRDLV